MAIVPEWSGVELRAFRVAARWSQADLAARLEVSERGIAKAEAAGSGHSLRPITQAMLDDLLRQAPSDVHARLVNLLTRDGETTYPVVVDPEPDPVLGDHFVKHPRDGKLMVEVTAGIYLAGPEDEPRWEDTFWLDAHPVTGSDYARFIAATGHRAPEHWPDGRCPLDLYTHPVTQVTWHDAIAYADWAGRILPTAAQWEKAARGPNGNIWPWGNEHTAAKCNVKETGLGTTSKVSRFQSGISPFYAYDMVGNVWEWTQTPTTADRYELKGGAWTSPLFTGRPSTFNDADAAMHDNDTGFRCAKAGAPLN